MKDKDPRVDDTQYGAPLATAGENKQVPAAEARRLLDAFDACDALNKVKTTEEEMVCELRDEDGYFEAAARLWAASPRLLRALIESHPADPAVVATGGIAELSNDHARQVSDSEALATLRTQLAEITQEMRESATEALSNIHELEAKRLYVTAGQALALSRMFTEIADRLHRLQQGADQP
jgi:hypothetical protein